MTLVERVAQWPEQWRQEGVVQGRREEAAERLAWQRGLLLRQARLRFGDQIGGEVQAVLDDTEDWDRLAKVAELIVSAASGRELTDAVAALAQATD